jgi:hypothetical protein
MGPTGAMGPRGGPGGTGPLGFMGYPGVGSTGPTGLSGITGPTGPAGASSSAGELLRIDALTPLSLSPYIPPPGANLLYVQLWGAGGGGAGATTGTGSPQDLAAGGGGGGGGYTVAYISGPAASYPFVLVPGGAGGIGGAGGNASQSWFSSPTDLFANGGQGGQTATRSGLASGLVALGGVGGNSGGVLAETSSPLFSGTGSAGGTATSIFTDPSGRPNTGYIYSGTGGCSAFGGGGALNVASTPQDWPLAVNGFPGTPYGGGGSGGCVSQFNSSGVASCNGGTGADAHLIVIAYS